MTCLSIHFCLEDSNLLQSAISRTYIVSKTEMLGEDQMIQISNVF